jgi:hypothetical protein
VLRGLVPQKLATKEVAVKVENRSTLARKAARQPAAMEPPPRAGPGPRVVYAAFRSSALYVFSSSLLFLISVLRSNRSKISLFSGSKSWAKMTKSHPGE